MTGYIKHFVNGGKNMSFVIKDDVLDKCNEIWDNIKETLSIKFHSIPVYDEQYIKAKVREFSGVINTNFLSDEVPKENKHYTCSQKLGSYFTNMERAKKLALNELCITAS